jgi:hypothetical protein
MEAEADTWETKTKNVLSVYIYVVHIIIEGLTFTVPTTAAQHKFVNTTLFSPGETKILDKRSDELYLLARRAFILWIRVVRWKTGMALVDVDSRPNSPSSDGGRLFNLEHGGSFYVPRIPRVVKARRRTTLTPQTWQAISDALVSGEIPPIWNEYFASSQRRIEAADLRAGVIDLAIAAEAAIAQYPHVSKTKRDKTISKILDNWDQFGFPPASPWLSDLRNLNPVRNDIMHRGDDTQVDLELCKKSLAAIKNLINLLT